MKISKVRSIKITFFPRKILDRYSDVIVISRPRWNIFSIPSIKEVANENLQSSHQKNSFFSSTQTLKKNSDVIVITQHR